MQILKHYILGMSFRMVWMIGIFPIAVLVINPMPASQEKSDRPVIRFGSFSSKINAEEEALKLFDTALELSEQIEDDGKLIETLSHIALQLTKAGFKKRGEIVFVRAWKLSTQKEEDIYSQYYQDTALRNVARDMAKAEYWDRALEEAQKIISPLARAEALYEIALVLIDVNNFGSAREILLEAAQAAQAETGFYGTLSNSYCESPKQSLLSKIAQNLSHIYELESALDLGQNVGSCYSMSSNFLVNPYQADVFFEVIEDAETVAEIHKAWMASQKIPIFTEKALVWSAIAEKMVKLGEYECAISIARKLTQPFQVTRRSTIAEKFLEPFFQAWYLQNIALALAEEGEWERSKKLVQLIPEEDRGSAADYQEKATILVEVTIAQQKLLDNLTEEAIKKFLVSLPTFHRRLDESRNSKYWARISDLYGEIVLSLITMGKEEQGIEFIRAIPEETREKLLIDIRSYFVREGQVDKALNFWSDRTGLNDEVWKMIISKMTQLEQLEKELEFARKEYGIFREGTIALQLIELSQIERGYSLIYSMKSGKYGGYSKVDFVEEAIALLVQQGEKEKALELLQSVESLAAQVKLLSNLGFHIAKGQ